MNKTARLYENILKHLDSAYADGYLTDFLDEAEISDLLSVVKDKSLVSFSGGFKEAERKRAYIGKIKPDTYDIAVCKIIYDKRYGSINHRQVLGTIISLGIKREMIGDIVFDNNDSRVGIIYFATSEKLAEFFKINLVMINNCKIDINILTVSEIDDIPIDEGIADKIIVASTRLDAVIAQSLKISRNDACEKISEKMVLINHRICENMHYFVKTDDLISIRKYGRIQILRQIGKTKKDRLILEIKRWH